MSQNSLLLVAAEESSCTYATRIIKKLNDSESKLNIYGVGNAQMSKLGFETLARAEDLAVMGFFEVFKNQKKIRQAYADILEKVKKNPPRAALLMDYGGFNLRLAKDLKLLKIPVIYFIPPKIWVWKKNRVYKIKKFVDRVLVIHPFEVNLYKSFDVKAEYVGHPLVEELYAFKEKNFSPLDFKNKLGLGAYPVLSLMPGSRFSEVKRHLNPMLSGAEKILAKKPYLNICLLVAPNFEIEDLKALFDKDYNFSISFVKDDSWKMIAMSDYLVTASGTATLQVGLLKKPQVIVYIMNSLTALLADLIVKGIKNFGLVNIILKKEACTELYQSKVTPEAICKEVLHLINKEFKYDEMLKDYEILERELEYVKTSEKVIEVVREYLK